MGAKPVTTPIPKGLKLSSESGELLEDVSKYRRVVGRLLYLGFTRPDITYVVHQLSQYVHAPRTVHWSYVMHVLKYLKGCPSLGLFYPVSTDFQPVVYSDADWAACMDSRKSLTGYCVFLGQSLVSWKCKKQVTVSRSSAEAEYRSMADVVTELMWISFILRDLAVHFQLPVSLHCDNKAALHITANPVFHERTKHIDIDCHVVRQQLKEGLVTPVHVSSSLQIADIFTKSLNAPLFNFFKFKLGLVDFYQIPT
ncbi:hypothetical protein K2173_008161 [Erythroxylum novogranatense]|uniref:Copia protein n=1 Tax=Erythroxylum novogranatense TaxID=1862640 RepID=A0AAV8UC79_9ROSI|nr:hypothetical protein K2173_008161 [Erythroxylum novogranatense]